MFTFKGRRFRRPVAERPLLNNPPVVVRNCEDAMKARPVDRRIQRTRQLLHGALMALIQEQGFEALSVQDIIDRANVGRATFYAHFDSKEDLLASGIENLRASLRERQREALSAVRSDDRLFAFSRELFIHANELLQKMLVDLVRDEVKARWAGIENDTPVEAVSQFIGGGLFGLLIWWGNGKMRMAVEDVDSTFRRLAIPSVKSVAGH
jgi:AcrR family transcriptional regulator